MQVYIMSDALVVIPISLEKNVES